MSAFVERLIARILGRVGQGQVSQVAAIITDAQKKLQDAIENLDKERESNLDVIYALKSRNNQLSEEKARAQRMTDRLGAFIA